MHGLDQIDGVQSARLAKALWKNEGKRTPPPPHIKARTVSISAASLHAENPTNPDLEILQQSLKNKTKLRCILITKNQSLRFLFITGLYHLAAAKRLGWIGLTGPAC
jgi:hypothetical protein